MGLMLAAAIYITCVVIANVAFSVLPIWHGIPAATAVVGVVFVARDYTQRSVGHRVIWAMAIAAGLSFLLADPVVATASVVAFALSELADWLVYTITGRPFADRVLVSSLVGVPVDSATFLWLLPFPGAFTWQAVVVMSVIKMIAAIIIWSSARALPVRRHA